MGRLWGFFSSLQLSVDDILYIYKYICLCGLVPGRNVTSVCHVSTIRVQGALGRRMMEGSVSFCAEQKFSVMVNENKGSKRDFYTQF